MSCVDPTSDMKHEGSEQKPTWIFESESTYGTEAFHRKNHEEVHSTHKNCATFEAGKLCVFQTNRFWPAPKEFKQNASMGALIEEKKMIIHQWVVYMNL